MSLSPELTKYLADLQWFRANPVALEILKYPSAAIDPKRSENQNLNMLLTCMTGYGASRWQYLPTGAVNISQVLSGMATRTDCTSLARIFVEIAGELGKAFRLMVAEQRPRSNSLPTAVAATAPQRRASFSQPAPFSPPPHVFEVAPLPVTAYSGEAKQIKKDGYRLVTAKGLADFTSKKGDPELEGRWCFGDHWVAAFKSGSAWDPSFIGYGKPFHADGSDYIGPAPDQGWWALEVQNSSYYTNRIYTAPGRPDVYCFNPGGDRGNIAYTFSGSQARKGIGERIGAFIDSRKSNTSLGGFEHLKK